MPLETGQCGRDTPRIRTACRLPNIQCLSRTDLLILFLLFPWHGCAFLIPRLRAPAGVLVASAVNDE